MNSSAVHSHNSQQPQNPQGAPLSALEQYLQNSPIRLEDRTPQIEAEKLSELVRKYSSSYSRGAPLLQNNSSHKDTFIPEEKKYFQEKVSRDQEERLQRLNELKRKLQPKQGDDSLLMTTSHMQIQPEVGEEENAGDRQNLMEEAQVMTIEDMMEMIPDEEGKERQRVIRTIEKMIEAREAGNQREANYKRNHPSAFNVFNRLYSYAQTKQRDQQSQSQMHNASRISKEETSTRLGGTKPGHALYQEFLNRQERLKAVQEAQRFRMEQQRIRSKVNVKSHQLAYRKLERDLAAAVHYVDYEDTLKLTTTQVGQLLYVVGVFKYLYNEEYERQQSKKGSRRYVLEQPLNTMQIKIEERKLREEEFLIQFWLKVNPPNEETVDSSIVLEFLKLIYDPYIASQSTSNQEELVGEYVIAIRRLCNLDDQESEGEVLWSVPELLRALRYLTDNFASFKSGSSRGGIKVPSEKQRANFYEASKECTFKPAINKKSEVMERQHWANFFRDQHQRALQIGSTNERNELDRGSLAGRIVNNLTQETTAEEDDPQLFRNPSLANNQVMDELESQVNELQRNPLKLATNQRIELLLEKDRVKQQKLKDFKQAVDAQTYRECTFKPQINKAVSHQNLLEPFLYEVQPTAHERLWELSKAKRVQINPQTSVFDQELEQLQECTFTPQINQKSREYTEGKKRGQVEQSQHYVKGYEESIMRLKKAKELSDLKKAQIENIGRSKYTFSGQPTVAKPFALQTEYQRQTNFIKSAQQQAQAPLIDVEITIATGKVVHLTIREGDDVKKVTRNFCKTYALNEATRLKLEEQLAQHLIISDEEQPDNEEQPSQEDRHEGRDQIEEGLEFEHLNTHYPQQMN